MNIQSTNENLCRPIIYFARFVYWRTSVRWSNIIKQGDWKIYFISFLASTTKREGGIKTFEEKKILLIGNEEHWWKIRRRKNTKVVLTNLLLRPPPPLPSLKQSLIIISFVYPVAIYLFLRLLNPLIWRFRDLFSIFKK